MEKDYSYAKITHLRWYKWTWWKFRGSRLLSNSTVLPLGRIYQN